MNVTVIGVAGGTGSGKSTLLRCINLLETPDEGSILYHGDDILSGSVNMPRYHAKVGMVFQQFNLFGNMTVLENCVTGQVKVLHRSREESVKNAMKYLEKVGMDAYVNAKPRQLSGGQQMSRRARSIRRWSARCFPSCRSWRRRA